MIDERYIIKSPEEHVLALEPVDKTVLLLDTLLHEACTQRASDIHLQPHALHYVVRMRIDGVLTDNSFIDHHQAASLIIRLKALARLDIAQHRLPQDGHMHAQIDMHQDQAMFIDFRIATFPTLYGEKIVIRVLDRKQQYRGLNELGLEGDELKVLAQTIKASHGLILATGPTGSGKTTLLYALLNLINTRDANIVTLEDPVEYVLDGVSQTSINPLAGLTFASGLRSLLRQDPDVVMVGEIRDAETAAIALQASLTGHLVLSTLHTNSALSALVRLRDLGVQPFVIQQCVRLIIAQRLVRLLCSACKKQTLLTKEQSVFLQAQLNPDTPIYEPVGCARCKFTGYSGRVGIFEIFVPKQDDSDALISADYRALKLTTTLLQSACKKLLSGQTSFDQVVRALF